MTVKILFVDDEPDLQAVIERNLRHKVCTQELQLCFSRNGAEALIKLQDDGDIDIVMTDIDMPVMDGFTLLANINVQYPFLPAIVISAHQEMSFVRMAMNRGAFDFLVKPLNFPDLEQTIQKAVWHIQQTRSTVRSQQQQEKHQQEKQLKQSLALARYQAFHKARILKKLQQTEAKLIQNQKILSLGQLVTDVALEINNPINFISVNIRQIDQSVRELTTLLELYQLSGSHSDPHLQQRLHKTDLASLRQTTPQTLASMKIGADRIRQMVLTLRHFSQLDETKMRLIDLHESIDNTMLILQNRCKAQPNCPEIQIIKHYGTLPKVQGYISEFNQVFINLIGNAIDALRGEMNHRCSDTLHQASFATHLTLPRQPTITITTQLCQNDRVSISIQDNGPGIVSAIKDKIFTPFFTTKVNGRGTGLGLFIVHQIIVGKHQGRLDCRSQLGRGTEFRIELPVHQ